MSFWGVPKVDVHSATLTIDGVARRTRFYCADGYYVFVVSRRLAPGRRLKAY